MSKLSLILLFALLTGSLNAQWTWTGGAVDSDVTDAIDAAYDNSDGGVTDYADDTDAVFPETFYTEGWTDADSDGTYEWDGTGITFADLEDFIFPADTSSTILYAHFVDVDDEDFDEDSAEDYQTLFLELLDEVVAYLIDNCATNGIATDCGGDNDDDDENEMLDFLFRWLDFSSTACGFGAGGDDLCDDRETPLWPGLYAVDRADVFGVEDGEWEDATCYDDEADDWTVLCESDYRGLLSAWLSDIGDDEDDWEAVGLNQATVFALLDEYEIAATYGEDFTELAELFCGEDEDGDAIGWDDCDFPFDAFCAADVDAMLLAADDSEDFGRDALDDMNDFLVSFVDDDEETATGVDFLFAMCGGDRSDDILDFYDGILDVFALALADDVNFPYTATCTTSLAAGVAGLLDAVTGVAGLPGCAACDDSLEDQIAGFTCASAADIAALAAIAVPEVVVPEVDEEEECDEDDEDEECEDDDEDASQSFALGFSVLAVLASLLN